LFVIDKEKELVFDPLVEAYGSLRTRSYSYEVDFNESCPQNMLKSIIQASEIDLTNNMNNDLFTIPELDLGKHSLSEMKSLQKLLPPKLKKNQSFLISQELSENEIENSEEEEDEEEEERVSLKELAAPTVLKRSSSIPTVHSKSLLQGGTPKNVRIYDGCL